jgi:MHS family proline/betaine transporter-like MFS transporter
MSHDSGRKLSAASIGNFGEIYDFAVFAFSIPIVAHLFFPGSDPTAAILSTFAVYAVAFFARPVGGLVFGYMLDRVGRVKVLALTIWLMAGATALIGVLPTYETIGIGAPALLVLCRLAQGFAMGGETTGSTSYILESAPDQGRGRWVGIIWFFANIPNAFVAVMLLLIQLVAGKEAYTEWVWRVPFLAGGLIGIIGFWLRRNLEDPEEFKLAISKAKNENPLAAATSAGWKSMLHVLMILPVQTIGSYLLVGFMYTFLVRQMHMEPTAALLSNAAAIAVMALFYPVGGALSDKLGRKRVMTIGALWIGLAAYPVLKLVATGVLSYALLGQALLAAGIGMYSGSAFTAAAEFFPTAYRATGHAVAHQGSVALLGGTTPFVSAWLVEISGTPIAPGYYVIAAAVVCLITVQFVPETKDVRLRTAESDGGQTQAARFQVEPRTT